MASLDSLLHHMNAQGATLATLRADVPIQLQSARGPQTLGVIAGDQLERDIREIAPPDALASLDSGTVAQFTYAGFQFVAQNAGGAWQLQIAAPATAGIAASANEPNTSGQGAGATLPPQLRGWNWGAFFLSWIWAIGNSSWIGLLALVPCIGFFARFWLGAKGNEWSWRNRRWNSIADFQNAQKTWTIIGAVLFIGGNVFMLPITAAILFPVFARARENARRTACQSQLKQIDTGLTAYLGAHDHRMPTGTTFAQWKTQLSPDLGADAATLYHCPSDTGSGDSYQINPKLSGIGLEDLSDPSITPVMWDKDGIEHLDTRNVLFADHKVRAIRESDFETQLVPLTH